MGLFDSFLKSQPGGDVPVFSNDFEAFFSIVYCAANADGEVDDFEIDALGKTLIMKQSFSGYDIVEYLRRVHKQVENHAAVTIVKEASKQLSEQHRKAAFVISVEIMLSNGVIAPSEQAFINELLQILGLDEVWAKTASEVILLKYN